MLIMLAFAAALLAGIVAVFSLDRIVELESSGHHDEWKRDGRPSQILAWWKPDVRRAGRGHMVLLVLMWKWLFVTPHWAREDQRARAAFVAFRLSYAVLIGACCLLIVRA